MYLSSDYNSLIDISDYMGHHDSRKYLAQLDALELYLQLILMDVSNIRDVPDHQIIHVGSSISSNLSCVDAVGIVDASYPGYRVKVPVIESETD
ncbi:hypothetical protein Tco_1050343 [Tanacetum coccineum]